ncbi:Rnase Y domain-containing protein, partial [Chitinophagales bacterium]|nr:Rnase Y domain-containing protein [Chitinophagales bacterium]
MEYIIAIIVGLVVSVAGFFMGQSAGSKGASGKVQEAELQAKSILDKANLSSATKLKEAELAAKERSLKIQQNAERDANKFVKQAETSKREART